VKRFAILTLLAALVAIGLFALIDPASASAAPSSSCHVSATSPFAVKGNEASITLSL
jgi:hypothetical protein